MADAPSSSQPAQDGGDPMASIRPALPERSPVLAPTLELEDWQTPRPDHPGSDTAEIPVVLETHESGPFIIPVREASSKDDGPATVDAAYQLLNRIGEGGMGEVWQARQRSLGRIVALKRLRAGRDHPTHTQQFESEARLAAVLDHPNIVTIHELGHDQAGRIFYTMKLSEGTPWDRALLSNRRRTQAGEIVELELRDHLEILLEVANAIGFAHSRGVIHRDIKPGNVMLGDYGEVLVVDWGLAVAMDELTNLEGAKTWTLATLPRSALVCGTPAYMSPETADADRDRIGPATDVYLLGAVLFHVLYRRPPHEGRTVEQVIAKAKANMWEFPEEIPARLRPWHTLLRPVLLRALATDPGLRFTDAGAFADDLRKALRNYDSAKLASAALEQLAKLENGENGEKGEEGEKGEDQPLNYQVLANIIARLEQAIESWPRNLSAHRGLALARLRLAQTAFDNGDLALANFGLEALARMPEAPEPEQDLLIARLTLHPPDRSLVGAPRPLDSLLAIASSRDWVGSGSGSGSGGGRARGSSGSLKIASSGPLGSVSIVPEGGGPLVSPAAATVDAFDIVERRRSRRAEGTSSRLAMGFVGSASVSIEQLEREELIADDGEVRQRAASLRAALLDRGLREQRRRFAYQALRVLAAVLAAGLVLVGITAWRALVRERVRAEHERDQLSQVLLDEAAATAAAKLDGVFAPVHGALLTSLHWGRNGTLDSDDPAQLNDLFRPLLGGLPLVTSMLRADGEGLEYMLLHEAGGTWITRETHPDRAPERCRWNQAGDRLGCEALTTPYDPHERPWYTGGAALRAQSLRALAAGQPPPVNWTAPYTFFTTKELGISISAPCDDPDGRRFVIAFDLKLSDISRFTSEMPQGVARGQVFILDDADRFVGLPREVPSARWSELLLQPILEVDAAVISRQAFLEWTRQGRPNHAFRMGEVDGERYWVGFRRVDQPDRPKLAIGVVVPESHFLLE